MTKTSTRKNSSGWLALGAVALGILCAGIGIWILSWSPRPETLAAGNTPVPAATRPSLPTAIAAVPSPTPSPTTRTQATPTASPTRAAVQPTPTVAQLTPTAAAAQPTPLPSPTPTLLPEGYFYLTIVHSNDTWGYTLPCG